MTRVRRAHSFVLDLSDAQRSAIEKLADGRRAAYNFALALDRDTYAADLLPADWAELEPDWTEPRWNERRSLDHYELNRIWPRAGRTLYPWSPVLGQPAQIAFADYTKARDAAIRRKRGFPRFRSRFDPHQTVSFAQGVAVSGEAIRLPTIGTLRVKGSTRRLRWFLDNTSGTIQQAHLVRSGVHAPWRCVLIVEIEVSEPAEHTGPVAGLDLGISRFLTLSSGEVVENQRPLQHALRRLRTAQKWSLAPSRPARRGRPSPGPQEPSAHASTCPRVSVTWPRKPSSPGSMPGSRPCAPSFITPSPSASSPSSVSSGSRISTSRA